MKLDPLLIEKESFRLIDEALREEGIFLPEKIYPLIRRAIHATGDLSLAGDFVFHPQAVEAGISALKKGASLVCDVKMVAAGINRSLLKQLGGEIYCFIDDPEVISEARKRGLTRAYVAMEKGLLLPGEKIIVVGNAPTALLPVLKVMEEGRAPALVIGVPVGFVGAAEYKALLARQKTPFITLKGPRGGSSVAVALVNALLRLASEDETAAPL